MPCRRSINFFLDNSGLLSLYIIVGRITGHRRYRFSTIVRTDLPSLRNLPCIVVVRNSIASVLFRLFVLGMLSAAGLVRAADFGSGFKTQAVAVDGGTVSVTVGGSGPPVVLIHGYAETSRMWKPLAIVLAPKFTVIAPDLPGIGDSSIPNSGIDMKTSAERVHMAVRARWSYTKVRVVGHGIGLMVAHVIRGHVPARSRSSRSWTRSCPALTAGRRSTTIPQSGTSDSTVRRPKHW